MIEFGLYHSGRGGGYSTLREIWLEAERQGFDSAWIGDNVVGPVPGPSEAEVFDAWSVLGALAEATSRIRIGPLLTPVGRRNPALFSKLTSITDLISEGRLNVGMGPGDESRQFEPWGMSYASTGERLAMLREELDILRLMWTQPSVDYDGRFFHLKGAINNPKPIQDPHPPIWIGIFYGMKVMPRIAAEYADGINFGHADDEVALAQMAIVEAHCNEIGRDFAAIKKSRTINTLMTPDEVAFSQDVRRQARDLGVSYEYLSSWYDNTMTEAPYERVVKGNPEECAEQFRQLVDMGFEYFQIRFGGGWRPSPDIVLNAIEVFGREVIPRVRGNGHATSPVLS